MADHHDLHEAAVDLDDAALVEREHDGEDDKRRGDRLPDQPRVLGVHGGDPLVVGPADPAQEHALNRGISEDQRRRHLPLEGIREPEAEAREHRDPEQPRRARRQLPADDGADQQHTEGDRRLDDDVVQREPGTDAGDRGRRRALRLLREVRGRQARLGLLVGRDPLLIGEARAASARWLLSDAAEHRVPCLHSFRLPARRRYSFPATPCPLPVFPRIRGRRKQDTSVPGAGLEPARRRRPEGLSLLRLPFRHPGTACAAYTPPRRPRRRPGPQSPHR